jgi:choline dehydrogenase-like flavoprotein
MKDHSIQIFLLIYLFSNSHPHPQGQVKGINNLCIADISIYPKIPGYFPVIPIAVAAEKIADDIIKQANQ